MYSDVTSHARHPTVWCISFWALLCHKINKSIHPSIHPWSNEWMDGGTDGRTDRQIELWWVRSDLRRSSINDGYPTHRYIVFWSSEFHTPYLLSSDSMYRTIKNLCSFLNLSVVLEAMVENESGCLMLRDEKNIVLQSKANWPEHYIILWAPSGYVRAFHR